MNLDSLGLGIISMNYSNYYVAKEAGQKIIS